MAKEKEKGKKPKNGNVKVKLSDGSYVQATASNAATVKQVGKPVLNNPGIDEEESLPIPNDIHSKHKYPPPKKNPLFRAKWGSFIDNVVCRDNFKIGHLNTLEILCDLYVELDALNRFIRKNGLSFEIIMVQGKSRRIYPEVNLREKVRTQINHYTGRLDLFPKRDKMAGEPTSEEDDKWT